MPAGEIVYYDMSQDDYLGVDAVSASFLKVAIAKTLAHARLKTTQRSPSTPDMDTGSALHDAVLRPHLYNDLWLQCAFKGSTKEGLAERAAARQRSPGIRFLNQDQSEQVVGMRVALASSGVAPMLRAAGKAEVSLFWDMDGLPCKARLDWLTDNLCLDLKTCQDASDDAWERDAFGRRGYGYHIQQAWYESGMAALGLTGREFMFACIEKEPPHGVVLRELDRGIVQAAWDMISNRLPAIVEARKTGAYPCYAPGIRHTKVPDWMKQAMAAGIKWEA